MRDKRNKRERIFIANASITPFAIHTYTTPINGFESSHRFEKNKVHLKCNATEGVISYKASKRIELALSWLLYKAKPKYVTDFETGKRFMFKINFITLTLPSKQLHSDQEIKSKCLNNFLAVCRKKFNLSNYMWRAEAQANGNIHFHLVTDKYIHYKELNRLWNQSINLLGYVDRFHEKFKHRTPPSTDVHSVKHVKRLVSYLSKYFAKNKAFGCIGELRELNGNQFEVLYGSKQYKAEEANKKLGKVVGHVLGGLIRKVEGRQWFCSQSLSCLKPMQIDQTMYEWQTLEEVLRATSMRRYEGRYVYSFYGDIREELKGKGQRIGKMLDEYVGV